MSHLLRVTRTITGHCWEMSRWQRCWGKCYLLSGLGFGRAVPIATIFYSLHVTGGGGSCSKRPPTHTHTVRLGLNLFRSVRAPLRGPAGALPVRPVWPGCGRLLHKGLPTRTASWAWGPRSQIRAWAYRTEKTARKRLPQPTGLACRASESTRPCSPALCSSWGLPPT